MMDVLFGKFVPFAGVVDFGGRYILDSGVRTV